MDIQAKYAEKKKRVDTAVAAKIPDRVPIAPKMGMFYGNVYGVSYYDVMMDIRNIIPGVKAFLDDFDPDVVWAPFMYNAPAMEALGTNFINWPGPGRLPLDSHFQILDGCYIEDEEFPEFAHDPLHFILTKALPRKHKNLKGLSKLDFRNAIEINQFINFIPFTDPEVKEAIAAMTRAGEAMLGWATGSAEIGQYIASRGYPMGPGMAQTVPYDMFGDNFRGLVRTAMDVYERPDELEEVIDAMTHICLDSTVAAVKGGGLEACLIPLHGAVDEFMSPDNFNRFYWKGLKKLMDALVENNCTPYVFCEGNYNTRLETLAEYAGGKAVFMFEKVDIKKAKETIGRHSCICGNVPAALLAFGTPEKVADETKRILDICAPGGGFIMDASIELTDAQPRNLEAMFETTYKYGKY